MTIFYGLETDEVEGRFVVAPCWNTNEHLCMGRYAPRYEEGGEMNRSCSRDRLNRG